MQRRIIPMVSEVKGKHDSHLFFASLLEVLLKLKPVQKQWQSHLIYMKQRTLADRERQAVNTTKAY